VPGEIKFTYLKKKSSIPFLSHSFYTLFIWYVKSCCVASTQKQSEKKAKDVLVK